MKLWQIVTILLCAEIAILIFIGIWKANKKDERTNQILAKKSNGSVR